ncbi:MAG TPA: hypothetical protein VK826_13650 [Bacteroidia bacterium]|nr:hypothetical protein [Bacteroidia bacterium]
MKTIFGFILVFAFAVGAHAQTKRIAHRSHSGAKHEKYDDGDGEYGRIAPSKIKIHLESGKDTVVYPWDSLARPYYLDTLRPHRIEKQVKEMEDIDQFGQVTGKMIQ